MEKQRLLELAGVQLNEADGQVFVIATDDEGFTSALVGPFSPARAKSWVAKMMKKGYHFKNPQEPLDIKRPINPGEYEENFE